MPLSSIALIAVALAMDAFAVAVATGCCLKTVNGRQTFRLAWHFGFFQALMPVIGWATGLTFRAAIERYDHWIAFALLVLVGGKMLKEAFEPNDPNRCPRDPTRGASLIMLSVATSIDALAVGLSLAVLQISIWTPALVIGLVAGGFTIAGLYLGQKAGSLTRISHMAEAAGGVTLIVIGINILYEHGALNF